MPGDPLLPPSHPELSVVVLCYRAGEEARAFVSTVSAALAEGGITSYELVLVANYHAAAAATDPTPRVARELAAADPRIVVSALPKQGGMGWDLRTGLALARGEVLAFIDGDGQILASDLAVAYRRLRDGGLDLVKAARVRRDDGWSRRTLSRVYNGVFRLLFPGLPVTDINGKPKILTRAAYERLDLTSDDWFIDAEIMIQARRLGFAMADFETVFLGLEERRSFVRLGAVGEFLGNLARAWRREQREEWK